MKPKAKRRVKRTLIGLVSFYITSVLVLYLIQDLLLFHPKPLPLHHQFHFTYPFKEVNLPVGERNLNLIQFKTDDPKKGIVLYFHGNMHNIERYADQAPSFTRKGYEVWMADYPGFGKSTGKRTEQVMYDDALLIYNLATKEVNADNIILYGRSIGTGVAAFVASMQPCQQLILEAPYFNMETLASHYAPIFPVRSLMHYRFPTNAYLTKVKAPVTILHGTYDEVIPYWQAERLAAIKGVQLITIPKGKHNNLSSFPIFQQTISSLLNR